MPWVAVPFTGGMILKARVALALGLTAGLGHEALVDLLTDPVP